MEYINTPINKIGRVVTGKTPSTAKPEFYGGEIMFITPTELHAEFVVESSEKTITQKGFNSIKSNTISGTSVMVGCIGWDMGNVALCIETCATNQQINSITEIGDKYNPLYLYYWLKTKKDYLFSIASVTRTPILSKGVFEEIIVPIPEKDAQNAIVGVLSSIDKKIALNNHVNDNLAA
jgi:type I restriction enzyme S subunit